MSRFSDKLMSATHSSFMTKRIKISRFLPKGHGNPSVSEILASDRFQLFVSHTVTEYERTGQIRDVRYFLNTFSDTKYFKGFLLWICGRLGLTYKWSLLSDDFLLRKSESMGDNSILLEQFLEEHSGSLGEVRREDKTAERAKRKEAAKSRKVEENETHPNVKAKSKSFPIHPRRNKKAKTKNKVKNKRKIDAMAMRLPGSFGSGRS